MRLPVWLVQLAVKLVGRPMLGWLKRSAQAPVMTVGPLGTVDDCGPEWADIPVRIENRLATATLTFPGPWRFEGTSGKGVPPHKLADVTVVGHGLQGEITPGRFREHVIRVRFDSLAEKEAAARLFYRVRVQAALGLEVEGWYPSKP